MNIINASSYFKISENMTDLLEEFKKTPHALAPIVKAHALNIQANAANDAPVDTGALMNSIIAEALDENNWVITDGVEYGAAQELGSAPRAMKPHFLGRNTEREADPFFQDVRDELGGGGH
jgi:hypothetical protein